MPRSAVVDLSHHNSIPQSLVPARQAGVVGVIHKLTQGTTYVDDTCAARQFLARDSGLCFGTYHYLTPGDMAAQVDFYLNEAELLGLLDGPYLFACDYEEAAVSINQLVEFMQALETMTGRAPVLYSGHVLKDNLAGKADPRLSKYRLWVAQYSSKPTLPPGFASYWLWQFSDKGEVPGITPPTDVNDYQSSDVDLVIEWSGLAIVEPPEPTAGVHIVITPPGGPDQAVTLHLSFPAGSTVSVT